MLAFHADINKRLSIVSAPSSMMGDALRQDSTLHVGAYELCSSSSDKYFFVNGYIGFERGRLDSYFYYAKDHLGNVRHVDRSTPGRDNGIVQITNYYPFGGILNESFNRVDYQNKLYNGKEYDRMHGLNLYDYSARQYDPAIGQFTSIDPLCEKYYHISPYAYCAGNPVKYVDPDGRELYLSGNDEVRRQLLALLQSLTNNVLVMNKQGMVSIGKGKANTEQKLTCGTGLIKDIIGNQHKMTMSVGKENSEDSAIEKDYHVYADKDGSPRSGADVVVTIDLKDKQNPIYLVGNDPSKAGEPEKDGRPLKIGVAHELVHGLRGMEGVQALPGAFDSYFYTVSGKGRIDTQDRAEELRTVGVTGNYRYSENKIRREHGLKERRRYNPFKSK